MEVYAKQAMNTEAERMATELRIRAECKGGHLHVHSAPFILVLGWVQDLVRPLLSESRVVRT